MLCYKMKEHILEKFVYNQVMLGYTKVRLDYNGKKLGYKGCYGEMLVYKMVK